MQLALSTFDLLRLIGGANHFAAAHAVSTVRLTSLLITSIVLFQLTFEIVKLNICIAIYIIALA